MQRISWLPLPAMFFSLALPVMAQDSPLFPRFTVTGGGYRTGSSTDVRLDGQAIGRNGTDYDFEHDGGLDASQWTSRFSMRWRPFERHELGVNYFTSRRDGSRIIDREIVFRDTTFPVHAVIDSHADISFWDASYTWWMAKSDDNGLGLNAGISGMSIDMGLATATATGVAALSQNAKTDLPVPVIGLEGRHAFSRRFIGQARIAFLPKVKIEDLSANALVGNASIEYRLGDVIGIGAAYNYFNVSGAIDKPRFNGHLGITVRGPEAFIRFVIR
jgi:hypothetical protein